MNWTPKDIVQSLDWWYAFIEEARQEGVENPDNKKKFVREVMKIKWLDRPKFETKTLRRWLGDEANICESARLQESDDRKFTVQRASDGRYPEVEYHIAAYDFNLHTVGGPKSR